MAEFPVSVKLGHPQQKLGLPVIKHVSPFPNRNTLVNSKHVENVLPVNIPELSCCVAVECYHPLRRML
jgi:hypothetical protein